MVKTVLVGLCLLYVGTLVQSLTQTCTMDNCDECVDILPQCFACPDRTAITDDLLQCVSCSDNCDECVAPTENDLACVICDAGYFLVEGECVECDPNCFSCLSADACAICDDEYFVNEGACEKCPSKCKSCSNADTCNTCTDGTYKGTDGKCKNCPSKAETCRLNGEDVVVNDCEDGYVVAADAASCYDCPTECSACSSEEGGTTGVAVCTDCDDEYYLDGEECLPCLTECEVCEDDAECQKCNDGYTLKSSEIKTCQLCSNPKTIDCTITASTETTTACEDGYYVDEGGVCQPCIDNCASCTAANACDISDCEDGYYRQESDAGVVACLELTGDLANCKSLDQTAAADPVCDSCVDGYFVESGACSACIDDCVVCADATTCTTCIDGYDDQEVDGSSTVACLALPDLCTALVADAAVPTPKCDTCVEGYYVDSTFACVKCATSGCGECTDSTCTKCKDGYYDDGAGGCEKCLSECATCSDDTTCDTCDNKFGLNTDTLCEACDDLCAVCTDLVTDCETCVAELDGVTIYTTLDAGVCQQCPENCVDCSLVDNAVSCDICAPTYTVLDGECIECPTDCDECEFVDIDGVEILSCTDCSDGYGTNTAICPKCPSNCELCTYEESVGVKCTQCKERYVVMDGKCEDCPSDCLECDTRGICKDCADGYGLSFDGKSCVLCSELTGIDNCLLCSDHPDYENDTASCIVCNTGYYLVNQVGNGTEAECAEFPSNLDCGDFATVIDFPPYCEGECELGYSQEDGVCGKTCFMCGDPRIGATVSPDACVAENVTGAMFQFCPDGVCFAALLSDGSNDVVMAGCSPNGAECIPGCEDVGENTICNSCCTGDLCNFYANDPEYLRGNGNTIQPVAALTLLAAAIWMMLY